MPKEMQMQMVKFLPALAKQHAYKIVEKCKNRYCFKCFSYCHEQNHCNISLHIPLGVTFSSCSQLSPKAIENACAGMDILFPGLPCSQPIHHAFACIQMITLSSAAMILDFLKSQDQHLSWYNWQSSVDISNAT